MKYEFPECSRRSFVKSVLVLTENLTPFPSITNEWHFFAWFDYFWNVNKYLLLLSEKTERLKW